MTAEHCSKLTSESVTISGSLPVLAFARAASGALAFSGSWRRLGPQRPGLPVADDVELLDLVELEDQLVSEIMGEEMELINDYEVTTVSGFFITELGNIPNQGDKIIWNKLDLEALTMDGAKIDKVLIKQYKE